VALVQARGLVAVAQGLTHSCEAQVAEEGASRARAPVPVRALCCASHSYCVLYRDVGIQWVLGPSSGLHQAQLG
jgi:hypothetical protein